MLTSPHFSCLESILALRSVFDSKVAPQESEDAIAENIVRFDKIDKKTIEYSPSALRLRTYKRAEHGSGLLLMTDGFVLTAYHNISRHEKEWRRLLNEDPPTEQNREQWLANMCDSFVVADQKGYAYPIDITFWATDPLHDIALIKAYRDQKPEAVKFNTCKKQPSKGKKILLFGIPDNRLLTQFGFVAVPTQCVTPTGQDGETRDTFLTTAHSLPGLSGGAFMTVDGRFAGVTLYSQEVNLYLHQTTQDHKEHHTEYQSLIVGYAGGAKIKHVRKLIQKAADSLSAQANL